MRLPTIGKALGVIALAGAAASVNAANLALAAGSFGLMPSDLGGGPGAPIATLSSPNVQDSVLNFTAQVESAVTVGNTYGASALNFWYKMSNVNDPGTGNRPLQGLSVAMPGPTAAVELNQTAGPNKSDLGQLTAGGSTVSFTWVGTPLTKGVADGWVVVYTPYTAYTQGFVGVQDGTTANVPALVPVPEPATYAGLFALGLAGFAAYRRFRV